MAALSDGWQPEGCPPTTNGLSAGRRGTVVVGLGSPNGDDRIGWLVAEEIGRAVGSAVTVQRLMTPVDVTFLVEGFGRVVIVDAIRLDGESFEPRRFAWPSREIAMLRASGTHAIGLAEALELAGELKLLPRDVVVWGIPGRCFAARSEMSLELDSAAPRIAQQIIERDLTAAEPCG